MNIFDVIKNRVSIRSYKNDPVPKEILQRILEAACRAPSWGNKQCWRFIVIDSKVEKNLIGKASGQDNVAKACEEAPYVIVLCANPKESGVKNGMEYYLFDSALAMDNLMLAAQAEGLATCIVGFFDEKAMKGLLNIPDGYKVIAYTPLGYAGEDVSPRARRDLKDIVYYNQWNKGLK